MSEIIDKTFKSNSKDIKYINRDFSSLKEELVNFTKKYYPQSYRDFSAGSPGQIFIEQAAYVGDVLSYYIDSQFKESFIQFATDRRNLINQARSLGYKPKVTRASSTTVEIYQLLPSTRDDTTDGKYIPDEKYALILKPNTQLTSEDGISFIIEESVDFGEASAFSPREVSVYNRDETGAPLFYMVKKTVKVYSGRIVTKEISVTGNTPYLTIELTEPNVLKILSVKDSGNENYYEVDFLAQDTIPLEVDNSPLNNQTLSKYKGETPKLLKYLRTAKRFITFVDDENKTYLQFGSNTSNFENTIITPNPTNVGVGLSNLSNLNISLDGTNILKSDSYGTSPSDTTLSIQYIIGGGIEANVNSGAINRINSTEFLNDVSALTDSEVQLLNDIKNSLRVSNPESATGGNGAETNEEIRQNSLLNFSAQNRMVTDEDILLRVYSLPSQFGSIAKAYVESNSKREVTYDGTIKSIVNSNNDQTLDLSPLNPLDRRKFLESTNPFTNNLYLLTYDANKKLKKINEATIFNLKKYLSKYKILTDRINFIDGYIINIGIDFKISVFNGFNKKEVLNECITSVKNFFTSDSMSFNQPINLSQLTFELMKTEGVQSVINIDIKNLTIDDGDYSPIAYNLSIATQNNIVYPSKDPSIFEIKYPESDIRGIVV